MENVELSANISEQAALYRVLTIVRQKTYSGHRIM
jgi:hypothetical protein